MKENGTPETVQVRKLEEKQSDVSLGAWMVFDAMRNEADAYFLLSNDSDFAGLLKLMREEIKKPFGLISPTPTMTDELLLHQPRYVRKIRAGALLDSQFPDTLRDSIGTIRRPATWVAKSRGPDDVEAPRPVAEASGDVAPVSQ